MTLQYGAFSPEQEQMLCRHRERYELRRRGMGIGLGLLGMNILPFILSTLGGQLMNLLGLVDAGKYEAAYSYMQPEVYYIYYAVLYLAMILVPFMVLVPVFGMDREEVFPLAHRKIPTRTMLLASVAGLAVCMVANLITVGWCTVLEGVFGIVSAPGELPLDDSIASRVMYYALFAILPPIAEEISFRGVVFGLLRPYGKTLAVVGSALAFGVMHGNLQQIPFAFLGGLFFGYLVAETGSIVPTIVLHFLNNSLSVLQEFALTDLSEDGSTHVLYLMFIAAVLVGIGALVLLMRQNKKLFRMEEDRTTALSNGAKCRAVFCHPAMLAAYGMIVLNMVAEMLLAAWM